MSFFKDQYGEYREGPIAAAAVAAVVVIVSVFAFFSEFYAVVPPAHKGLVVSGGQLQSTVLSDGFTFKTPFWDDVETIRVSKITTDNGENVDSFRGIQPLSKDGQMMEVDAQIEYQVVDPVKFRTQVGTSNERDIESLLFIPTFRSLAYDYVSEYTWKNLIQGGDRQELGQRIYESMSTGKVTRRVCSDESRVIDNNTGTEVIKEAGCELMDTENIATPSEYGVIVTSVKLRKVAPNANIIAAVEEAQKKEQQVKIAEQEAEIAKQQANKLVEEKRGETEARKLAQEAEAYKVQVEMEANAAGIKAEAEAKRLQAVAERELAAALQQSQGLIDYKRLDIEKVYAEAALEYARHYQGNVPQSMTIIGDKAAENNSFFYGNGVDKFGVMQDN